MRRKLSLFRDYAAELTADEARTIRDAVAILERTLRKPGACLTNPGLVADYVKLQIAPKPYEVFLCLFLDAQNRLIEAREMFRGTLAQTSVYPREVVKAALGVNAAAVICRVRTRRYRRILP